MPLPRHSGGLRRQTRGTQDDEAALIGANGMVDRTSRPVSWGFIGARTWASRYLIPAVATLPDARGVGVYSSSRERGHEYKVSNGLEKAYGTLDEMLADPEID